MAGQASEAEVVKIVKRVIAEQIGDGARIVSVSYREGRDSDDDPILILRVVFETESGKLDAQKTSGLLRHLRPKLAEKGEDRFPLISFISKSDLGKLSPEAA